MLVDPFVARAGATRSVVDLGAGTGANLRYLAPRLGSPQDWLAVDSDPVLLGELARRARRGPGAQAVARSGAGPRGPAAGRARPRDGGGAARSRFRIVAGKTRDAVRRGASGRPVR